MKAISILVALAVSGASATATACALAATHIVQPIGIDVQGTVWVLHAHLERSPRGCAHHQILLEEQRGESTVWHDIAPNVLPQNGSAPVAKADNARCKVDDWLPDGSWRAMAEKWVARDLRPLSAKGQAGASVTKRGTSLEITFADGTVRTVDAPRIANSTAHGGWSGAAPFVLWESPTVAWVMREARGSSAMHAQFALVGTRIDSRKECTPGGCVAAVCTSGCAESVRPTSALRVLNVAADDHLNMRAEPSASSAVVAELPPTATCLRYEGEKTRNGDTVWLRLRSGQATGWVSASFVEAQPLGTCREP